MKKSTFFLACSTAITLSAQAPQAAAQTPPVKTNYLEVGFFGGMLFPSSNHAFQKRGHETFDSPAPELGARMAYFPIGYVGAELEGAAGGSRTSSGASAALWAGRLHGIVQLPGHAFVPFALIGGGLMGAGSNPTGTDSDKLFHFGAGVKADLDQFVGLRLDVRDNLTQKNQAESGTLTHSPELTLGLTFTIDPGSKAIPQPSPPADLDTDGIIDADDKCPNEPGVLPHGCPAPKDSDGDGVTDLRDACPNEAGLAPTGCPERDADHDCVPIPADKCPEAPGLPQDGCPDPDPDHDGIAGSADQCPDRPETTNGYEDGDGCPDTLPEKVKKYSGVVPGIEFDLGRATIRPASRATLDEATSVLEEYAALRIAITGHTDNQGDRGKNLELSQQRAEAVKAHLVQRGIDASRIETRGAGPDEPIADNKLAAGRQKNRRIEFKLLQK